MSDTQEAVDTPKEESKSKLFAYDFGPEQEVGSPQSTQAKPEAEADADSGGDLDEEPEGPEAAAEEPEEVSEEEPTDSQDEEKSPKDDPDAFQYWQSQAQKYEGKLGVKPDEISDEEAQLFDVFRNHPEYLDKFAQFISGGGQAQQQEADSPSEEGPKTLQRPEKPEKPVGYDPYEAVNDPESDSYKYRVQHEQYLEDLAEYNESLTNSVREEVSEKERERQQQIKAQQVKSNWYNHMTTEEGLSDEQFQDFWSWKDKGEFAPEEIVTMYKAVRGIDDTAESQKVKEREKKIREKQERKKKNPPSPATAAGAGNQREVSKSKKLEDEQLFGYF